jgi:RimJ/RimL family protein N-acetyltransferase
VVRPEAQGKGHGTDAVERLVEYGLEERRLHRIGAGARADNDVSRAMLETLGFVREGCRREHCYVDGEYVD